MANNEDILDIEGELEDFVSESLRSIAASFFNNVTVASPVDTGMFRANWVVGFGSPDTSTTDSTNFSANLNKELNAIQQANLNFDSVIYFNNNLPYAVALNNGSSEQAPKFFVEKAARRAGINIRDGAV